MLAVYQAISPSQGNTESRNVSFPFWEGRENLGTHFYTGVASLFCQVLHLPSGKAPQEGMRVGVTDYR